MSVNGVASPEGIEVSRRQGWINLRREYDFGQLLAFDHAFCF
jgi:hypothetical protein